MIFWIATALMAGLVAILLIINLLRPRAQTVPSAEYDLRVYRDQLKEVDRDLARGVIGQSDAERIRAEVSRRILAADAQMQDGGYASVADGLLGNRIAAVVFGVAVIGGTFFLYLNLGAPGYGDLSLSDRIKAAENARQTRPDQAAAEASLPDIVPTQQFNPDYMKLVEKLRQTVAKRPNDVQGQQLLARNEAAMGNYIAAYRAQRRVLQIKGDAVQVGDLTDYGDMLILAAQGYVSPEAEGALARALELDPKNGPALYYYGLMLVQTGRPDRAFQLWENLLNKGPVNAPWIEPIRFQIEEIAILAGVKYTLPEIAAVAPERGPNADDIQAAAQMSDEDRQNMIKGMVNGLSERLATEGGPPADWARLITALGVLGNEERAIAIYTEALEIFAGNTPAIKIIRDGARRASLIP